MNCTHDAFYAYQKDVFVISLDWVLKEEEDNIRWTKYGQLF